MEVTPVTTRASPGEPKPTSVEAPDTKMDDLAGAMSSLQFVPSAVKFGRGRGKTGFAKC